MWNIRGYDSSHSLFSLSRILLRILAISYAAVFLTACLPIARAGDDQTVNSGASVQLDGTASFDIDGDPLSYTWSIVAAPPGAGENAFLDDPNSPTPIFTTTHGVTGTYVIQLMVNDGTDDGIRDIVLIHVPDNHTPPGNPGDPQKPAGHINTTNTCAACHDMTAPVQWLPVQQVDHAQVIGSCISCHDGTQASGKPANHINSSDLCDSCHLPGPSLWTPVAAASVNHSQVIGTCVSCHNGVIATGKSSTHPQSDDNCESCHSVINWQPFNNANTPGGGNGEPAPTPPPIGQGKPPGHIASTNNCAACHTETIGQLPVSVDHKQVLGLCSDCHQLSATHTPTNIQCNACHSSSAWLPATDPVNNPDKPAGHINSSDQCRLCHGDPGTNVIITVDHSQVLGSCISCHNGVVASGKSSNHITTTDSCDACHTVQTWIPADAFVDHTQVVGECVDCHNGIIASGQALNHIDTQESCGLCHSTVFWLPAIDSGQQPPAPNPGSDPNQPPTEPQPGGTDHSNFVGTCVSCHNGIDATGKSANHIITTDRCDACHTTQIWAPMLLVDHTQVIGSCVSCHNGILATGKSPLHPASDDQCETCHNSITWLPALPAPDPGTGPTPPPTDPQPQPGTTDHSNFVGSCVSCHNGVDASGKSASHIITTDLCEACHTTQLWVPALTTDHNEVVGICVSCHNGVIASGKSPTHPASDDQCDACHMTITWITDTNTPPDTTPSPQPIPGTVDHSGFAGTCVSCHDGVQASGKPAGHIATTANCDACHVTQAWLPVAAVNHTQVVGVCTDCHQLPALHTATQEPCEACHTTDSWANPLATPIP